MNQWKKKKRKISQENNGCMIANMYNIVSNEHLFVLLIRRPSQSLTKAVPCYPSAQNLSENDLRYS